MVPLIYQWSLKTARVTFRRTVNALIDLCHWFVFVYSPTNFNSKQKDSYFDTITKSSLLNTRVFAHSLDLKSKFLIVGQKHIFLIFWGSNNVLDLKIKFRTIWKLNQCFPNDKLQGISLLLKRWHIIHDSFWKLEECQAIPMQFWSDL